MKHALNSDCLLRGVNGFILAGIGFLAVSFAFSIKVWQMGEQAQLGEAIFWLFLAAWGKALALGVVGLFLILMLVRALWNCQEKKFLPIGDSRENFKMTG